MTIYLLKDYPEYAATSLADAKDLLAALADPSTSANSATIDRVQGKLKPLVQSDTGEPLVISSIDDTDGTISAWVTDPTTSLAVGLGDGDPVGAFLYSSTIDFTISGNTRIGTLALNTTALRDAIYRGRFAGTNNRLGLQVRKTASGVTQTLALIMLQVRMGVLTGDPVSAPTPSYPTTAAIRAGYIINLAGITSLTGGGAAALDGIEAGTALYPVGCIGLTSDSSIGRHWKLIGTYISATDLDAGLVKPTNSDAVLNPCHWKLI